MTHLVERQMGGVWTVGQNGKKLLLELYALHFLPS